MSLGKAMIHARKQKAIAKAVVITGDHGTVQHAHAHILQMPVLVAIPWVSDANTAKNGNGNGNGSFWNRSRADSRRDRVGV